MCQPMPGSGFYMNIMIMFAVLTWGLIFTLLVLIRLDRIIKLLEKK